MKSPMHSLRCWRWGAGFAVMGLVAGPVLAADEAKEAAAGKSQKEVVVRQLSHLDSGTVYGNDGKEVGHINSIAIDASGRRIAYAVVEFDRMADIGDKQFAIPWKALDKKVDPSDFDKITFAMNVNADRLKQAKGFDENNWPNMADAQWQREVNTFWNVRPEERDGADIAVRTDDADVDVDVRTEGTRIEGAPVSPGKGGMFVRSNHLIGHAVYDQSGKDIADLENVMADVHSGRLVYGIMQFNEGPDLEKDFLYPVPFQMLRVTRAADAGREGRIEGEAQDRNAEERQRTGQGDRSGEAGMIKDADSFRVVLAVPTDKVKGGPKFPERDWPNMTREWGEGVFSAYGVKPFWSKSAAQ